MTRNRKIFRRYKAPHGAYSAKAQKKSLKHPNVHGLLFFDYSVHNQIS